LGAGLTRVLEKNIVRKKGGGGLADLEGGRNRKEGRRAGPKGRTEGQDRRAGPKGRTEGQDRRAGPREGLNGRTEENKESLTFNNLQSSSGQDIPPKTKESKTFKNFGSTSNGCSLSTSNLERATRSCSALFLMDLEEVIETTKGEKEGTRG
jgi:hypothetical protein